MQDIELASFEALQYTDTSKRYVTLTSIDIGQWLRRVLFECKALMAATDAFETYIRRARVECLHSQALVMEASLRVICTQKSFTSCRLRGNRR